MRHRKDAAKGPKEQVIYSKLIKKKSQSEQNERKNLAMASIDNKKTRYGPANLDQNEPISGKVIKFIENTILKLESGTDCWRKSLYEEKIQKFFFLFLTKKNYTVSYF